MSQPTVRLTPLGRIGWMRWTLPPLDETPPPKTITVRLELVRRHTGLAGVLLGGYAIWKRFTG